MGPYPARPTWAERQPTFYHDAAKLRPLASHAAHLLLRRITSGLDPYNPCQLYQLPALPAPGSTGCQLPALPDSSPTSFELPSCGGIRAQTDAQTQAASDSRAAGPRAASFRAASLAAGAELAAGGAGSGSRGSSPEVVRRSRRWIPNAGRLTVNLAAESQD